MTQHSNNTWKEVQLGDHVDLLTGYPFKSKQFTQDDNDIRLLRGDNVAQGFLRWNEAKRWSRKEYEAYSSCHLQKGDVILAMDRPWISAGLKYAWIKDSDLPCLLVQRVARLRGTDGLLTDYLRYVIGSHDFTNHVLSITTGVNVPHISGRDIKAFRFKLPPEPVQERAVSILSAYDDLIENNMRRIEILEEMARRLYEEWFVHFRFPGHEEVSFKESELGEIPEGWKPVAFSEVASFMNGFAFKPSHFTDDGLPVIKIKELKSGVTADTPRCSGEVKEKYLVKDGDVLFSWSAHLDAYIWRGGEGWLNQHLFKVDGVDGIPKSFLYFSLKEKMVDFRAKSMGTTMQHIKRSALNEVKFPMAAESLTSKFDDLVTPILNQVLLLQRKNGNLRAQRDLLLPKLVSGEIDVSGIPMPEDKEVEAA